MLAFDYEDYRQQGRIAVASRKYCEEMAEKLHARGYSNLVMLGLGGTTAKFMSLQKIIEKYSDIEMIIEPSAEALIQLNKRITKDSLVITGSKSGNTKELVESVKMLEDMGIQVCSVSANADTPLARASSYNVYCNAGNIINMYLPFYYFLFRLLYLRGDFPDYKELAEQLDEHMHEYLIACAEKFDDQAAEWAKKHYRQEYQVWVGGGEIAGDIYMFTQCVLEEMLWIKTGMTTSAEFFHGPLELYDEDTLFVLVKGNGSFRKIDERVEAFLNKMEGMHEILDLNEFTLENSGISPKFASIMGPMIMETVLTNRLAAHLEYRTGHNANFRRYYRKFDY